MNQFQSNLQVSGATLGCVVPPEGYFTAIRAVCDKYGALLILDEVMCGMGRTGTTHAWQQYGVAPDIQTCGKGLGGGYQPIAAILINGRVYNALHDGSGLVQHGQTYQAHPIACTAALAVRKIIRQDGLMYNVAVVGDYLGSEMVRRFAKKTFVGDVRGVGLFRALEFVRDKESKIPFPAAIEFAGRVGRQALEFGASFYPGSGTVDGFVGDHILVSPSYNIKKEQVDEILTRLESAIDQVSSEVVREMSSQVDPRYTNNLKKSLSVKSVINGKPSSSCSQLF